MGTIWKLLKKFWKFCWHPIIFIFSWNPETLGIGSRYRGTLAVSIWDSGDHFSSIMRSEFKTGSPTRWTRQAKLSGTPWYTSETPPFQFEATERKWIKFKNFSYFIKTQPPLNFWYVVGKEIRIIRAFVPVSGGQELGIYKGIHYRICNKQVEKAKPLQFASNIDLKQPAVGPGFGIGLGLKINIFKIMPFSNNGRRRLRFLR